MYSLHLKCTISEVDQISSELWEQGTVGIHEIDNENNSVELIAGFETNRQRAQLLRAFATFSPRWRRENATDWVAETHRCWPARPVGMRLFVAPVWSNEPTPPGRQRVIHNPGLACGTGEHPCTRLALQALERMIRSDSRVADIGTGSGILAVAALRLGANFAAAIDTDDAALGAARENLQLNGLPADLVAGSADCLGDASVDLAVANISARVLLSITDDLLRIVRADGALVLTGFPVSESNAVASVFTPVESMSEEDWVCFISRAS
jgi:ribosomal protein L11 methyltransferase